MKTTTLGILVVVVVAAVAIGAYVVTLSPAVVTPTTTTITTTTTTTTTSTTAGEPILIGFTVPLTGASSEAGKWIEKAYLLWAADVNKAGGLLGRPVGLVYYDDKSTPADAASLVEKLISVDGVDIVFGGYPTMTNGAVSPIVESHGKVYLGIYVPMISVYNKDYYWVFQGPPASNLDASWDMIDMLASLPEATKPQTFAVLARNDAVGVEFDNSIVTRAAEKGFDIIFNESYDPSSPELTAVVSKAQASNADVLLCGSFFADGSLIVRAEQTLGWKPQATWVAVGPQLPAWRDQLGEQGNYYFGYTPYAPKLQTPANMDFVARFKAMFPEITEPHYTAGTAYYCAQVYQQAIERAGSLDQEEIRAQIVGGTFDTILGQRQFETQYNKPERWSLLVQVIDGQVEIVWPEEFRTMDPVYPAP